MTFQINAFNFFDVIEYTDDSTIHKSVEMSNFDISLSTINMYS